jgi:hypothetical protein
MADDRITIDPEFLPPSREGGGRRTAWLAAGAAVVAAVAFGWLLGSPGTTEPSDVSATESTTTTVASTTSTTVAPTTTLPAPEPLGNTEVPLSQLVPGFTDTIVMLSTPGDSLDVARWAATESTPEVALSIERDDSHLTGGWPIGLDASGSWFAQVLDDGVLTVHSIDDGGRAGTTREAVGLRVGSAVWHDTEAGQLAWMTCARSVPGPTMLTTLDLTDAASEPETVRSFPQDCASSLADGVFLERWNDDALVVDLFWDERSPPIVIGADGTDIVAEPDDPILVEGVDGRYYRPVPGVAESELVVDTAWSPNGRLVAVNITPNIDSPNSLVRIVDSTTGSVVSERDGQGSGVISMTWSTDSRFLIYSTLRSAFKPGLPGPLVIHDVTTDKTTAITLSSYVDEIRTHGTGPPPQLSW